MPDKQLEFGSDEEGPDDAELEDCMVNEEDAGSDIVLQSGNELSEKEWGRAKEKQIEVVSIVKQKENEIGNKGGKEKKKEKRQAEEPEAGSPKKKRREKVTVESAGAFAVGPEPGMRGRTQRQTRNIRESE